MALTQAGRVARTQWWPAGLAWALWALTLVTLVWVFWLAHLLGQSGSSEVDRRTTP